MKTKSRKKKQTAEIFQKMFIEAAKRQLERQEKYYLVGITGRTSFILENTSQSKFKITIGNELKCSCSHKEGMHCIHTLYVLTEIFYLPMDDPLLEQCRYSNKDLRYMIANRIIHTNKIMDFLKYTRQRLPRIIQEEEENAEDQNESMCAICQMQIVKKDAITTCKEQCENVFHFECFSQWAKHQMSANGCIKCPLCRNKKSSDYISELKQKQYELIEKKNASKIGKEFYYYCDGCQLREIQPSQAVYKCIVCEDVTLCSSCFTQGKHFRHSFICKTNSGQKWKQCEDRKVKKKLDDESGLIRMKLPPRKKLYNFLAFSLPCYFSKNTRWNITYCKKLDIKVEELECIVCNDKQKAFLRRMSCGHFIHHRCLRKRIEKGKLFCKVDGEKFLQGYDSLVKHEKLNKDVQKIVEEEESEEQQKCDKNFRPSPSKSISIRTEAQSAQSMRNKIRSVKSISNNRSLVGNRSFNNPQ